jgi:hypothetical protein
MRRGDIKKKGKFRTGKDFQVANFYDNFNDCTDLTNVGST